MVFWERLDKLVETSKLVIDRPAGTAHPRYPDFIYPHDYGYLDGTSSMDGDGIDVWIGSMNSGEVTAVICTIDMTKRDSEMKILFSCTPQEAETILKTHNRGPQSGLLITRYEQI